ncbi:hypothetical protein BJV82DRAFT_580983 [Fennellomyces sp. T-0311]|nr:hypothetical protein BJV82DRAFT_580983 [Fennellomyces sp. T-0311]
MPHLISTSKPKRIFNYFLSLIGLDRFVISHDDDGTHQEPASSCSFLTASTLFVTHDDKKQAAPDAWTLQSWIGGLSKSVLCQIVWMGVMQYHDSTMWPQIDEPQKKNEEQDVMEELKTIQEQAKKLAHRLDALRPSEQFAHAAQVAQEFQQLVRLCVHLLHEDPLAATVAIMLIVQESFAAPPEVRQHIYYQAKLGRLVVLELQSVLKYHQGQTKRTTRHRVDYYALCVQTMPGDEEQDGWLEDLAQLCAKLARYDTTWEFRQEYQNVVRLAEQFYV